MAMPLKSHLNPTTPWGLMSVTLTATKASGGFFRLRASACGARAATAATATRARRERDESGSMVVLLAVAGDRCQRLPYILPVVELWPVARMYVTRQRSRAGC